MLMTGCVVGLQCSADSKISPTIILIQLYVVRGKDCGRKRNELAAFSDACLHVGAKPARERQGDVSLIAPTEPYGGKHGDP